MYLVMVHFRHLTALDEDEEVPDMEDFEGEMEDEDEQEFDAEEEEEEEREAEEEVDSTLRDDIMKHIAMSLGTVV